MKVVSWQPVLTDHQSHTLAALQTAGDCELIVYVARAEHAERQAQGWVNRHAPSLSPELVPEKGWVRFVFRRLRAQRDAVHLFGSPFEQPRLIIALFLAIALGLRVYLVSEPYSSIAVGYLSDKRQYINWLKARLRPFLYGIYGILLRRRIGGVFAISCRAVEQYRSIGIAREKIFPFGYFVPCEEPEVPGIAPVARSPGPSLKVVFIGNLIATKGLDLLIGAVKNLIGRGLPVSLDVYGPGDPERYAFDRTAVRYCGSIPFGSSPAVIRGYDVLVLPSRYDGWGVVVNEALMAGVPVICSDRVGAGAVVEKWRCGAIFAGEDVSDLANKLAELSLDPASLDNMRQAAGKAGALLDPVIAGRYMFDIIGRAIDGALTKPGCPWYDCE